MMMTLILSFLYAHTSKVVAGAVATAGYLGGMYLFDGFIGGTVSTLVAAAGYAVVSNVILDPPAA